MLEGGRTGDGPSRRYTLEHPELGTGPVPIEPYISVPYFEAERQALFRKAWLFAGRVQEIPEAGDYFVRDIEVLRTSVIVVRGRDGTVRCFHNVCVHRGNKLVWSREGRSARFTCKYHGWTYADDGRLIGVVEEDMFFGLEKRCSHLSSVRTEIWQGFIFISLAGDVAPSVADFLGDVDALVDGYPFDSFDVCFSYRARLRANWKVLVDSQQEGYHAKTLHSRSLPGFLTNRAEPSRHTVDMRLFRYNRLISYFGNREAVPTPSAIKAFSYGPAVSKFAGGGTPKGLNPSAHPDWAFDEYVLFPNMQLLLFGGMYIVHVMWPVSVDESIWEARAYLPKATDLAQRFSLEYSKVLLRDAWLEDGSTLEATQQGLESGAITHQHLQDQELLIRHSAKVIDDLVTGRADLLS